MFQYYPLSDHTFQFIHCGFYVLMEGGVATEEIRVTAGQLVIQPLVHIVDIRRYGVFYVILLPVHRGMGVHPFLLVEEAVCRFNAVFAYHCCCFIRRSPLVSSVSAPRSIRSHSGRDSSLPLVALCRRHSRAVRESHILRLVTAC